MGTLSEALDKMSLNTKCHGCPLLEATEPTDNLIKELTTAVNNANQAIEILNLKITEQDIHITSLRNALNKAARIQLIH